MKLAFIAAAAVAFSSCLAAAADLPVRSPANDRARSDILQGLGFLGVAPGKTMRVGGQTYKVNTTDVTLDRAGNPTIRIRARKVR